VQFVQLQENLQAFGDAGIGVVALTYDKPELQQKFIQQRGIEYAFLSDVDAYTIKTLGILDENYQPGDHHYGIPHPGIFILNPDMQIVGKIFVNAYEKRVKAEAVLQYALKSLD
jgi:peroxiredoxin